MNNKYFKTLALSMVALFCLAPQIKAQTDVAVDVMSRYVWRGTDFGDSPSIQPSLGWAAGGLEFGFWAAYATNGDPAGSEIDLWASYTFDTDAGSFSLAITDYTFPTQHLSGDSWFDSDSHFVELGVGYGGTDIPISLFAGMFVHNDDDNSVYLELAYDADPVSFFIGMTPSESASYGTTGAGVINLGVSGATELMISDSFSFGLSSSLIFNPYAETAHMVVGIGF